MNAALASFATFAFASSITPGPNNTMLLASGTRFGVRRTLPHLLGVSFGFSAMIWVIGLGLDRVLAARPELLKALAVVSLLWVLWIAYGMIRHAGDDPTTGATAGARPMTFLGACAFQWANPKAWAMALGALGAWGAALGSVAVAALFLVVNLPCCALWVWAGDRLARFLRDPVRRWRVNVAMALLLVASMLPVLGHLRA